MMTKLAIDTCPIRWSCLRCLNISVKDDNFFFFTCYYQRLLQGNQLYLLLRKNDFRRLVVANNYTLYQDIRMHIPPQFRTKKSGGVPSNNTGKNDKQLRRWRPIKELSIFGISTTDVAQLCLTSSYWKTHFDTSIKYRNNHCSISKGLGNSSSSSIVFPIFYVCIREINSCKFLFMESYQTLLYFLFSLWNTTIRMIPKIRNSNMSI